MYTVDFDNDYIHSGLVAKGIISPAEDNRTEFSLILHQCCMSSK